MRVERMADTEATAARSEPTDVRYSTRSLLLAMVAAAVTFPGLSAFIRHFPSDARPRLIGFWLVLVAMLGACVAYNARRRYLAEKHAGAVRFRLTPHSYYLPRVPALARTAVGAVLLLSAPSYWVGISFLVAERPGQLWSMYLGWQTYVMILASASGMSYLWWHHNVRVCDEGLVVRQTFVPWSKFHRWYWDACDRTVIVLDRKSDRLIAMKVPDEDREAVAAFLESKISAAIFRALAYRG
jgi:hypothetical protein